MSNYYQQTAPTQFSLIPPIVKNLLFLNALVFFAQMTFPNWLERYLALWPWVPLLPAELAFFRPWQVITYSFLHGGFTHLVMNMFALWMFGAQIERVWQPRRFAIYYFACVLGAAVAQLSVALIEHYVYQDLVIAPTVGASGGVFGILLAYGMMYPDNQVYFFPLPVPIKAKWFVLGYGVVELMNGMMDTHSNVAHFAHLGGMVFGLILMLKWGYRLPFKRTIRI